MSRKTSDSHNGLNDVIGFALLAVALLLLVSQWSFDRHDISFLYKSADAKTIIHNWIGLIGAYLAWVSFLALGIAAYLLPFLVALFGIAYLLNFFSYLRERILWSLIWAFVLLVSLTGFLYILDDGHWMGRIHESIGSQSAGGWLGYASYGQTPEYNIGFSLLGPIGATIVYITLVLISLLFLTNFHLGMWIRAVLNPKETAAVPKTEDESTLDRRARELEKQAQKLQEEVARSGLGADMLPVPEPTVRDLSVPQAKPAGPRVRKTTLPAAQNIAPPAGGEGVPPQELAAATTEEILGKKPGTRRRRKPKSRSKPGVRARGNLMTRPKKKVRMKRPGLSPNPRSRSPGFLRTSPKQESPNPSPWPRRRSSGITSCPRWISCSSRT